MALRFSKKPWTDKTLPLSVQEDMERVFKSSAVSEVLEGINKLSKQLTDPINEITREIERIHESLHIKEIEEFAKQFADLHSNLLGNWDQIVRAYEFLNPAISDDELINLLPDSETEKKELLRETIIAIGIEETKRNEKQLPKRRLRLGKNHRLYDRENDEIFFDLSDSMYGLLKTLRKHIIRTPKLTKASGYKNEQTTRRGVQRSNEMGYTRLRLAGCLVIGDKGSGYRLAKFIDLKL